MKAVLAATLAAAALLGTSVPAEAAPSQVRSALQAARAPVAQLEAEPPGSSLGVSFRRFRQAVGGVPVLGSELVVTDAPGRGGDLVVDRTRRVEVAPSARACHGARRCDAARRGTGVRGSPRLRRRATLAILPAGHGPRLGVARAAGRPRSRSRAARSWWTRARGRAAPHARPAPARHRLGAALRPEPGGGQRGHDRGCPTPATPTARCSRACARRGRCRGLDSSTCLRGSFVEAVLPPGDADADTPAGDVCAAHAELRRGDQERQPASRRLMAYFHIDRAQAYVQALGFANVPEPPDPRERGRSRSRANRPTPDRTTRSTTCSRASSPSAPDSPTTARTPRDRARVRARDPGGAGAGLPGGARRPAAMGEGFGDYLASAFSATFSPKHGLRRLLRRVGRVRVGPWATACGGWTWRAAARPGLARLHPGRRRALPRAGVVRRSLGDPSGAIGGATADRLVIQSHFSLTPVAPASSGVPRACLAADRALVHGRASRAAEGGARRRAGS